MAATGVSFSVMKCDCISLFICPRGLARKDNLQEMMCWESSDVVRFDLESLLQGQMRTANLKSGYNSFNIGPKGFQCETNIGNHGPGISL